MNYPNSLTTDEWNLLMKWSGYSKLDTWFCLCSKNGVDYVHDLEEDKNLPLYEALEVFCEGIYIDKKDWCVTDEEVSIWNELMNKFNLQFFNI